MTMSAPVPDFVNDGTGNATFGGSISFCGMNQSKRAFKQKQALEKYSPVSDEYAIVLVDIR